MGWRMNPTLTGSFNKDLCCFDTPALHSTVFSFIMKSEELYIITKEQLLLLPISCNTNYNDLLLSGYSKHSSLCRMILQQLFSCTFYSFMSDSA